MNAEQKRPQVLRNDQIQLLIAEATAARRTGGQIMVYFIDSTMVILPLRPEDKKKA